MALTTNLKWQVDVNSRGRTDNEFYDHVNSALMTKNSAPTVNTDQLFGAMDHDGTDDYFTQSLPGALSSTFLDDNFTIAVRFMLDTADTLAFKRLLLIGNSASTVRCDIGINDTTSDYIQGSFDASTGTDVFQTSTIDAGDGKAHVAVWRRSGTTFTLYIDGTETNTQTVTAGNMGTVNQINLARRGGSSGTQWYFPGKIYWAAIWDAAISDGDRATLHTSINPFLTDEDGDYVFGTAGSTLHFPPTGATSGDQIIMKITAGDGNLIPSAADINPTILPTTFNVYAWDVSALDFLSRTAITVLVGKNRVVDNFNGSNGSSVVSAHTPDVDEFAGGWSYAAENNLESVPSSGITIQGNRLEVNAAGGGVVIETGDTEMQVSSKIYIQDSNDIHTIQFNWLNSSNRLSLKISASDGLFILNQRHLGSAYPGFGSGTFDLSALGEFQIDIVSLDTGVDVYCAGTLVIDNAVPFYALNTEATKAGLFAVNQTGGYPVLYSDFTVNAETAPARSLTASDDTPTPGQVVTFTLVGTDYGSTIDDVTLNNIAATPANADLNSFDLTIPSIGNFVAGGSHETTGWYRNIPVISETDAEVSIQINAPVPANYGILGAVEDAVYAPYGLSAGDEVYCVFDSGTGIFNPATCDITVTLGPVNATIYGFDTAANLWVTPRTVLGLQIAAVPMQLSRATHEPDAPVYRNEVKFSNGFGNAAWSKNNVTVSYSSSDDSWQVTPLAASLQYKELQQNFTAVTGVYYTFQFQAKEGGYRYVGGIGNQSSFGTFWIVWDLQTGTETYFDAGTSTVASRDISGPDADGFYTISITVLCLAGGASRCTLDVVPASNSLRGVTWASDGTSYVKMRRFQAETGSTAHDYVHTEMVPLRSDQVIVRSVAQHNLIGSPNDLNSGYWTKTRASIGGSITLNAGASNGWGSAKLWKIVEDTTASNSHFITIVGNDLLAGNPSGLVTVRMLVACRASPSRRLAFTLYGDTSSNYFQYRVNLDTGALSTSSVTGTAALHSFTATQVDTLTIEGDASRPVWEVVFRGWPSTTSDTAIYNLLVQLDSAGNTSYTGDGSSGIFVGKIQVVNGYTLPDYPSEDVVTAVAGTPTKDWDFTLGSLPAGITFTRATVGTYYDSSGVLQEATSGTARFTHDPVTLRAQGLLIEPARTNSIRNNTMAGAVAGTPGTLPTNWTVINTVGGTVTTTVVATGTESGVSYVDLKMAGTAGAGGQVFRLAFEGNTVIAAVQNELWTASLYSKLIAGSIGNISNPILGYLSYDSGGNFLNNFESTALNRGTSSLTSQRASYSAQVTDATVAYVRPTISFSTSAAGAYDITLRIGLPQLEKGSFATMPIKTSTVAVTRNADVASLTGSNFSSWWNATNGTFWAEARTGNTIDASTTRRVLEVSDNTANERLVLGHSTTTNTRALITDGGVAQADITQTTGIQAGLRNKLAFSYTANSIKHASNGTLGTTDTSATLPTVDRMHLGADYGASDATILGGPISRVCYWNSVLSEDVLKQITGGYSTPFDSTISSATINSVAAQVAKDALMRYTEDQTQTTPWVQGNIHAVTAEGVSADEYPAYKVDINTTNGQHSLGTGSFTKTLSDSSLVTAFIDAKADERTFIRLAIRDKGNNFPGAYFNLSTGAVGTVVAGGAAVVSYGIESRGNGWYRCRIVANLYTGGTTPGLAIYVANTDNSISLAGLGANDGILVSRCFAVEGNIAMADADAAYIKTGATMEHVLDRARAIVTMPGVDKFDAAGTHAATRWRVGQDLELTDSVTTETGTVTFEPFVLANFGTVASNFNGPASPTGTEEGDDGYIRVLSGAGTAYPQVMSFSASQNSTIRMMVYDVSGGAWLAYTQGNYYPEKGVVGGILASLRRGMI